MGSYNRKFARRALPPKGGNVANISAMSRVLCSILLLFCAGVSTAEVVEITRADYTVDATVEPPLDFQGQAVELPYVPRGRPVMAPNSVAWFRFHLDRPEDAAELALYLWRHNVSVRIFMNGEQIGATGSGGPVPPIGWNHPLLIPLQEAAFKPRNVFHIRLQGGPFGGMVSSVLVGKRSELLPLYQDRRFWQVQSSQWAFALCGLMGLFTLMLWFRRRQDQIYLRFAGACLAWSVVTLYLFLDFVPMPLDVWLGVVHTGGTWCTYFLVTFVTRATGRQWPVFERSLLVFAACATLLHFVYPPGYFFYIAYAFHLVNLCYLLVTGVLLGIDCVRHPGGPSSWFSFGYIGLAALVAHDWYFFMVSPDSTHVNASNLLQFAIPFMLVVLFVHLVSRFTRALDETEHLNKSLETQIEQHRRALDASYAENRRMELARIATEERDKIYRDLHDDVGSRLLSIIHGSKGEREILLARQALESLRGAIYRASHGEQPADDFFAGLEEEMQLRTESAGLTFHWSQQWTPGKETFDADICYHLTRICREILTNALHHARATDIWVTLQPMAGGIELVIVDDGVGFDEHIDSGKGNGLRNVRHRADLIGVSVRWVSAPDTGTGVHVGIPCSSDRALDVPGEDDLDTEARPVNSLQGQAGA